MHPTPSIPLAAAALLWSALACRADRPAVRPPPAAAPPAPGSLDAAPAAAAEPDAPPGAPGRPDGPAPAVVALAAPRLTPREFRPLPRPLAAPGTLPVSEPPFRPLVGLASPVPESPPVYVTEILTPATHPDPALWAAVDPSAEVVFRYGLAATASPCIAHGRLQVRTVRQKGRLLIVFLRESEESPESNVVAIRRPPGVDTLVVDFGDPPPDCFSEPRRTLALPTP